MSYTEFDYWTIRKYVPDYICDEVLKNYNNFGDGLIQDGKLSDNRKSGVCWIDEPFSPEDLTKIEKMEKKIEKMEKRRRTNEKH